ncbi:MAG: excinuclease ABC subunit UvrA [Flavobacteriales bacterium]|tara:strand:+ start:397 stop:3213 length:2817 start_codon:yes stop_codon:yes gene_type:complete
MENQTEFLEVFGARVHNLKNIDVKIPRDKLVVITGLSGSGKSSLAFETIYAEGQRRYIETFSSYARQFLGNLERPDVDKITGLSPVISIEQKTVNKNPRSTVGTITEIYGFFRLFFSRVSEGYSYETGEKMVKYTTEQIINKILKDNNGKKVMLLSSVVRGRKGHYKELFVKIKRQGFIRAKVDGKVIELIDEVKLDRYKTHDIDIVVDRLEVNSENENRLKQSLEVAFKFGKGTLSVQNFDTGEVKFFSKSLMCPTTGIAYEEPEPNFFSFNSPYGACQSCRGLGTVLEIDIKKIIPDDTLSVKKGAFSPLGKYSQNWIFRQVEALLEMEGYTVNTPLKEVSEEAINEILYGTNKQFKLKNQSGIVENSSGFEGIINFISRYKDDTSSSMQNWAKSFMDRVNCSSCKGTRLKKEALYFKINDKNIFELADMDISDLVIWLEGIEKKLTKNQLKIGTEIIKEIRTRLSFLMEVGLGYLTINRSSATLSGGEAQRIRLATQIGTELTGVLYILDEPSIGLHQRDNDRLIQSLKKLRDVGNSVIVVEHDKDIMLECDYLIDIGPGAGVKGGEILIATEPSNLGNVSSSTVDYLKETKNIEIPEVRRANKEKFLTLEKASGNNLKDVTIKIPLQNMVCVTGVSGSGKSSLINQTLYPILNKYIYNGVKKPLPYKKIVGLENIDKVIEIDQSPIGRTPRSNPATYTQVFGEIRSLFAEMNEAKIRGYKPGRFSFNVKGGRCEECRGGGVKTIEMNFLPDVHVQCDVCNGKRYNRETLEVKYRGKSINDVLSMSIEEGVKFFEKIPKIHRKLETLLSVGLGYLTLGQPSTTLSGGEAQRVKLSTELSKKDTGNTFYILDEPTTGLHFEDIQLLLNVLNRLVDNGNTVLVIEHNMDIIKSSDYIIDIGPEGGSKGGELLFEGTPEDLVKCERSHTGTYLKKELK